MCTQCYVAADSRLLDATLSTGTLFPTFRKIVVPPLTEWFPVSKIMQCVSTELNAGCHCCDQKDYSSETQRRIDCETLPTFCRIYFPELLILLPSRCMCYVSTRLGNLHSYRTVHVTSLKTLNIYYPVAGALKSNCRNRRKGELVLLKLTIVLASITKVLRMQQ
jgi:hypothetical protein